MRIKDVLEADDDSDACSGDDDLPGDLAEFIGDVKATKDKKEKNKEELAKRKQAEKEEKEERKKQEKAQKMQQKLQAFNMKVDAMSQADGSKAAQAAASLHSILTKQTQAMKKLKPCT